MRRHVIDAMYASDCRNTYWSGAYAIEQAARLGDDVEAPHDPFIPGQIPGEDWKQRCDTRALGCPVTTVDRIGRLRIAAGEIIGQRVTGFGRRHFYFVIAIGQVEILAGAPG